MLAVFCSVKGRKYKVSILKRRWQMRRESNIQALLRDSDVAHRLGWSVGTVRNKRSCGEGPAFVRIGGSIRYRPEDVEAYIEANITKQTDSPIGGEDDAKS
jgi:predicted DNA-binding transcriptional regulator AlpA